jgi:membrane associated rhomboid family serine protease
VRSLRFSDFEIGTGWTEIVRFLILTNVTIFVIQFIQPDLVGTMQRNFGLVPADFFAGKLWMVVTYMFLHGGFWHIFFNMLVLWMFGSVIEREWGSRQFLKYYLLTGIGGGLSYALFNMHSDVPTVGASGAIYGLLAAYAVLFPDNVIYVWFVIPLRAKWFALVLGGIEFLSSFRQGSGVAHLAHLGGMAIGYIYLKRGQILPRRTMEHWREQREEAQRRREEEDLEKIRREVDDLLDKINRVGMDGLSRTEQKRLQKASKLLRDREKQD